MVPVLEDVLCGCLRSATLHGMIDTFKEMLFIRVISVTPILVLITAIALLVVVGFDEAFNPCPSFNSVSYKCSKTDGRTGRPINCSTLVMFDNFCSQTMHPRVTTCCRVPCFQNFTTYFDASGTAADCFSQPFKDMPAAIAGFVLLALSVASLLLVCSVCRVVPGFVANIMYIVSGRRGTTDSHCADQELPEVLPHINSKAEV